MKRVCIKTDHFNHDHEESGMLMLIVWIIKLCVSIYISLIYEKIGFYFLGV